VPEAELVAAVDANPEKLAQVKEKFGIAGYSDLDPVLEDKGISIVDICLPTSMHRAFTEPALAAGKHVLVEKPVALTLEDAKAMAAAAEKAPGFLMVAQVLRFWPEYAKTKEIIDSGELGKVLAMVCQRRAATPDWSWNSWLMNPAMSGGAALDLHIHDVDWICYCLGRPKAVTSQGVQSQAGWDHIFTQYQYDGIVAIAEGGWNYSPSFPFRAALMVLCEGGQIELDFAKTPSYAVFRKGAAEPEHPEVAKIEGAAGAGGNIADLGGYFVECQYFVNCVEKGEAPTVVTPADGVQAVEVALAEIESARTGKTVTL
jgi:predicted dehydrogenase